MNGMLILVWERGGIVSFLLGGFLLLVRVTGSLSVSVAWQGRPRLVGGLATIGQYKKQRIVALFRMLGEHTAVWVKHRPTVHLKALQV